MKYPMVKSENDRFWQKYCGFLDLSIENFMAIQYALLSQQLTEVAHSSMARKLLGGKTPPSVDGFRDAIPVTTYEDYLPDLESGDEALLAEKPYIWAHTSAAGGFKQVPYTLSFYNHVLDSLMAVFILSCAKSRGLSSLMEDDRVLYNVAPKPYLSGILAHGASERFNLKPVLAPDIHDSMDFREKVGKGFQVSLRSGVDILIAMTSVLVKMGNDFSKGSKNGKLSKRYLHPSILYRYAWALMQSKLEHRRILPKDLWAPKAIISWGIDTDIYREQVHRYWGKYPYEFHACTEAGIIAMQSWKRKDLTFVPYSNFFEFIPEDEWLACKRNGCRQPRTVLLSEVIPGARYELVITSFYRMPFIRYRLGHLVRITALEDKEAGIQLPQMVFEARADDLIDIAGFTRISEKSVSQALVNAGLGFAEWSIRKEVNKGKSLLHLYIEADGEHRPGEIASKLHQELKAVDMSYADLSTMLGISPLEVTPLRHGTFQDYYEQKRKDGVDLPQRKPPRMNAPDHVIAELLQLDGQLAVSTV